MLWWHKILTLSVELLQTQTEQGEALAALPGLSTLQGRLLLLGEERLSSGLLAAIGLGRRSPLSNRYTHTHTHTPTQTHTIHS